MFTIWPRTVNKDKTLFLSLKLKYRWSAYEIKAETREKIFANNHSHQPLTFACTNDFYPARADTIYLFFILQAEP